MENRKTGTEENSLGFDCSPALDPFTEAELRSFSVSCLPYRTNFAIQPYGKDQEFTTATTLTRDSVLYEMSPHMHYRGHRMRIEAVYADNSSETLLNVPGYQFAWQSLYRLAEPKTLPAGTVIRVTAGFDNSLWNPLNPDPSQTVVFGEQTINEMLIGYLNLTQQ